MLCSANVQYGAAILTYDDPDNAGNTITLIVVIFKRTNSVTCEVKEPTGEKGPGKFSSTFFQKKLSLDEKLL